MHPKPAAPGPALARKRSRGHVALYAGLLGANIAAWAMAWTAFHGRPILLGTAFLAWTLGLRHAVDADHIAAIDNVVRRIMQSGGRPATVGLWFSLGHSTVVVLACALIARAAVTFPGVLTIASGLGATVGVLVSSGFLIGIGLANLLVLRGVWRTWRRLRRGEAMDERALETVLNGRGLLARLTRPALAAVDRAWRMYPLGFLFGLGFDTATEVGLLGISASQAAGGLAPWQVMIFPALFTAGMALLDTTDSVLMVRAYGWAFQAPLRKLWYNLTITAASVLVALLIGGIEALGMVEERLSLGGPFWDAVGRLNAHFGSLGFAVVGAFLLCWAVSTALWRWRGQDGLAGPE
jgi:high-affinity nickel-transport protein